MGKVNAPTAPKQKYLFQILTMLCSVPLTVTLNWILHANNPSPEGLLQSWYLYPLTLCIVAGVRFLIANPLVDRFVKTVISSRLDGLKKSLCITVTNILFMSPVVALFKTLVLTGGANAAATTTQYLACFPESFLISFVLGYFFITPFMKKTFAKKFEGSINVNTGSDEEVEEENTSKEQSFFEPRKTYQVMRPVTLYSSSIPNGFNVPEHQRGTLRLPELQLAA